MIKLQMKYSFILLLCIFLHACESIPLKNKERDMEVGKADKYSAFNFFPNGHELYADLSSRSDTLSIEFKDVKLTFERRTEISTDSSIIRKSLYIVPSGDVYVLDGCVDQIFPLKKGAILNDRYNWNPVASKIRVSTYQIEKDSLQQLKTSFLGYIFHQEYFAFMFYAEGIQKYAFVHLSNDSFSSILYDYAYQN